MAGGSLAERRDAHQRGDAHEKPGQSSSAERLIAAPYVPVALVGECSMPVSHGCTKELAALAVQSSSAERLIAAPYVQVALVGECSMPAVWKVARQPSSASSAST